MSAIAVGAAQLGPIGRAENRSVVVKRLIAHLQEARARGCGLVVFPELALTTFFPRWAMDDQAEIDAFFEREMPGPETQPLFDEARRLGLAFCLGYAELASEGSVVRRYNTAILVDPSGRIVGKYRKIHCPATPRSSRGVPSSSSSPTAISAGAAPTRPRCSTSPATGGRSITG
jgi:predicted amidohydrolase